MNLTELKHFAQQSDEQDSLKHLRQQFHFPLTKGEKHAIYLCGNSLGLQPVSTAQFVAQELEDWRKLGVEGHFHAQRPWMPYHEQLTHNMANVIGALPSEVVCMNSLTVNLHLMMVSFYRPIGLRHKIIIEKHAFPSDQYAVESQLKFHGYDPRDALIEVQPPAGRETLTTDDILTVIDQHHTDVALALLPGVQYYTGQVFDIRRITAALRQHNIAVGWDLAHSAGNVPLTLHDSQADFAVWCNYKYMNAGPGAIGGCFVHQRHHKASTLPRFAGWWGHDKSTRFAMEPYFDPIQSAEGWQLSNPPILAMAPLIASLELFEQAGMQSLAIKSRAITTALISYLQQHFAEHIQIITPLADEQRGGQLSLRITSGGKKIQQALIDAGVICDWREPDCVRIAFAPLYNNFADMFDFAYVLHQILDTP